MCNLYSLSKGQAAIIEMTRAMRDTTGNMPPLPGIFLDNSVLFRFVVDEAVTHVRLIGVVR